MVSHEKHPNMVGYKQGPNYSEHYSNFACGMEGICLLLEKAFLAEDN